MIQFRNFSGERPLIEPLNLQDDQASYCRDCYLHTTGLDPLRAGLFVKTGFAAAKTLFRAGAQFIYMSRWTHFARSPIVQDKFERIYFTQCDQPGLQVIQCKDLANDVVGVNLSLLKAPTIAPVATLIEHGGDEDNDKYTTFVVTYVTVRDEETAPSPASNQLQYSDGIDGVSLSLPATTDADIQFMRVYMAIEGEYFLVKEVAASTSSIAIDPLDDDLVPDANNPDDLTGTPLLTANCSPPPKELCGLTALPNGVLAGFTHDGECQVTSTIHFSTPYVPHCWPTEYRFKIRYKVVALAAIPEGVLVLTEGKPSIITGSTPDVMDEHTLETYHSCADARSVTYLGDAVVWSSPDGVAVYGGRTIKILSGLIWSREQWQLLNPKAMLFGVYEDNLVIYPQAPSAASAGLPDWVANTEPKAGEGFLYHLGRQDITRLSQGDAHAVLSDVEEDCLWVVRGDALERFNEGNPLVAEWISKPFVVQGARTFNSARLIPQAETELLLFRSSNLARAGRVDMADEERIPFWSRAINHELPFRLASAGRRWQTRFGFRLLGKERLRAAFFSSDMRELP
ncbi:hypothetical protein [Thiolinea disciformis]|uniref:hypothetical protein n=1 Tax=Thiolinea disciformis TaxID=125614 RepID=UPI00035F742F|nr:hypothetical protein [Thiolinea disciformis]